MNPDENTAIPDATNMPNTIIEFRILIAETTESLNN